MNNNDALTARSENICFRCKNVIRPSDKIFLKSASLENENCIISSLCIPCASAILSAAVIGKNLTMPAPHPEFSDNEEDITQADQYEVRVIHQAGTIKSINPDTDDNGHKAALSFQVSDDGFRLSLQCPDGVSYATSEVFTWNRVAQLLIAANPDIFGSIAEPLYYVFPETLVSLGYNVPDWLE
jgi:hypothetical protein